MGRKYSKETLIPLVAANFTLVGVLRSLGRRSAGGNVSHLSRRIKEYGLDTSHFTGRASNTGGHYKGGVAKKTWKDLLIKREKGTRQKAHLLRRSLVESGREYRCEDCGQPPLWRDKPLTLEVDHINRDWLDDRKENLKFLCPHCHSQTLGWCGSTGTIDPFSTGPQTRRRRAARH